MIICKKLYSLNLFLLFVLVEFLKNLWKNLRESYLRCKSKRAKLTKSGSKASRLPSCNFFDLLTFLDDNTEEALSTSSTNLDDSINEELPQNPIASYRSNFSSKRKTSKPDDIDTEILASLKSMNNQTPPQEPVNVREESANSLFCKSLISSMDDLTPEQTMLARIKIQQVLFDIKYNKAAS